MDESQSAGEWKRRTFTDEFKQYAVRLMTVEKYTFKAAIAAARNERTGELREGRTFFHMQARIVLPERRSTRRQS
jgi:hypothetical protein